jgi:glycosyltransferase involved in cell wall biosynthesis
MDVLFLTKYDRKAASTRLRALKYFSFLRDKGIKCTYKPLFSDKYLIDLFDNKKRNIGEVINGYVKRLRDLLKVKNYDVIVLKNEILPYMPAIFERILSIFKKPYIVDLDDAVFHNYDQSNNPLVKKFLSQKIDIVMERAEVVVAGNEYIASRAEKAGASKIKIIPTPIDLDRYPDKQPSIKSNKFTIAWIGSPSTAKYLHKIEAALHEVCEKCQAKVRLIGSGNICLEGVNYEFVKWKENTEIENIIDIDVGIMPLEKSKWEKGKCGFKLLQYMGAWKPVVASPVGMNVDLVRTGRVGILAETEQEWVEALLAMANDPERRSEMGQRGRKKVEQSFCFEVTAPQWTNILRRTA